MGRIMTAVMDKAKTLFYLERLAGNHSDLLSSDHPFGRSCRFLTTSTSNSLTVIVYLWSIGSSLSVL